MSKANQTPQDRYKAAHSKRVPLDFNLPSEQEVYDFLQSQPNKAGFIKKLILQEMQKYQEKS